MSSMIELSKVRAASYADSEQKSWNGSFRSSEGGGKDSFSFMKMNIQRKMGSLWIPMNQDGETILLDKHNDSGPRTEAPACLSPLKTFVCVYVNSSLIDPFALFIHSTATY